MEKVESLRQGEFAEERTQVSESLTLDCFLCGKPVYALQAVTMTKTAAKQPIGPTFYAHVQCSADAGDTLWIRYEQAVHGVLANVAGLDAPPQNPDHAFDPLTREVGGPR